MCDCNCEEDIRKINLRKANNRGIEVGTNLEIRSIPLKCLESNRPNKKYAFINRKSGGAMTWGPQYGAWNERASKKVTPNAQYVDIAPQIGNTWTEEYGDWNERASKKINPNVTYVDLAPQIGNNQWTEEYGAWNERASKKVNPNAVYMDIAPAVGSGRRRRGGIMFFDNIKRDFEHMGRKEAWNPFGW